MNAKIVNSMQAVLDYVAPGVDIGGLGPDDDMRRLLDLDSLDFPNFVVEIDNRTGLHRARPTRC